MKGKQSWVGERKAGWAATVQSAKTMRVTAVGLLLQASLAYCPRISHCSSVKVILQERLTGRLAVGPLIALCYCLACNVRPCRVNKKGTGLNTESHGGATMAINRRRCRSYGAALCSRYKVNTYKTVLHVHTIAAVQESSEGQWD